jgi:hypothetical protein
MKTKIILENGEASITRYIDNSVFSVEVDNSSLDSFMEYMINNYNSLTYQYYNEGPYTLLYITHPSIPTEERNCLDLNISADSTIKPSVGITAYLNSLLTI